MQMLIFMFFQILISNTPRCMYLKLHWKPIKRKNLGVDSAKLFL